MRPSSISGSKRLSIRVTGRVQGVGYRNFVKHKADELGLAGWVRNEPDGAVMLEAEGSPVAVDSLVAACRAGPVLAKVDKIVTAEMTAVGDVAFEIAR